MNIPSTEPRAITPNPVAVEDQQRQEILRELEEIEEFFRNAETTVSLGDRNLLKALVDAPLPQATTRIPIERLQAQRTTEIQVFERQIWLKSKYLERLGLDPSSEEYSFTNHRENVVSRIMYQLEILVESSNMPPKDQIGERVRGILSNTNAFNPMNRTVTNTAYYPGSNGK